MNRDSLRYQMGLGKEALLGMSKEADEQQPIDTTEQTVGQLVVASMADVE